MKLEFSKELNEAKIIVKTAGKAILKIYNLTKAHNKNNKNKKKATLKVSLKDDKSEVTKADIIANTIIVTEFSKIFKHKIISEEIKEYPHGNNGNISREVTWLIDPLDGTKDFINHTGEFAVMVSMLKNAEPVLGVVYLPVKDKMYFAERKKGAYLEEKGVTKKIYVSNHNKIKDYNLIISKNHYTKNDGKFAKFLGIKKFLQKGSIGIKLGEIAESKADLYYNFDGLQKWDISAPQIILEEAHGLVVDLDGKKLNYKIKSNRFKNGIIAINKRNTEFFCKLMKFRKYYKKHKE